MTHPEHIPAGVDVRRLKLCRLRNPEPASVESCQHSTIAKLAGRFQECFDFLAAEDERQRSLAPWEWDALDLDFAVQGVDIENSRAGVWSTPRDPYSV